VLESTLVASSIRECLGRRPAHESFLELARDRVAVEEIDTPVPSGKLSTNSPV
jgi:hypothetical protein